MKEKPLLSFAEQFKSHYSSQAMRFENIKINKYVMSRFKLFKNICYLCCSHE